MRRQAIEFCKEQYSHNVIYCETRLCPHLFTRRGLLPEQALLAVIKGLEEGQKCHDIKVKVILSLIKSNPGKYYIHNYNIYLYHTIYNRMEY